MPTSWSPWATFIGRPGCPVKLYHRHTPLDVYGAMLSGEKSPKSLRTLLNRRAKNQTGLIFVVVAEAHISSPAKKVAGRQNNNCRRGWATHLLPARVQCGDNKNRSPGDTFLSPSDAFFNIAPAGLEDRWQIRGIRRPVGPRLYWKISVLSKYIVSFSHVPKKVPRF